jgi:putative ABC transport system substrate-binding protein
MKRRTLITAFGGSAVAWPHAARAQQPTSPVVGFLHSGSPATSGHFVAAFSKGLGEGGFIEGQTVTIDYRWAEGRYERLPALAAELVGRRVSVIFAAGGPAPGLAAKAATATIPIIFESGGDPVATGLVGSLARPGGNVTGVSLMGSVLEAKRLELLHELVPQASMIGVLINPEYPEAKSQSEEILKAATYLGVTPILLSARSAEEIDAAFPVLRQKGAGALIVAIDPFLANRWDQLVSLAARYALPAMYALRQFPTNGGLLSYGADFADGFHEAGLYVAKVLKGAPPADLPVVQPTKFELVINLKTAKALGLTIPPAILARADEVIE